MNITKLVASLQKAANTSTTSAELANLSRAIKGLNVGTVQTVANTASLPAMLPTNGNLYYVESEEDIYYNTGSTWNLFYILAYNSLSWGYGASGRLGTGNTTTRSSPVTVIGGITSWKQVSAGRGHSLGVTTTGIAYAWGPNGGGVLGDNTTTARSSPVTVIGGITNWKQVSAGGTHSLGVTSTGIAYGWGWNTNGRLGDNTATARSSPVTVVGGITNWNQVSAGYTHSLGLTSTGVAYAWGNSTGGRLGDNTLIDKSSPVTVVGGITNWKQISAGFDHSLGVTSTGIAYTWGTNGVGQLGDNTTSNRSSPVTVVGSITNWNNISTGTQLNLSITSTGILYAWGSNTYGKLGDNTTTNKSSPVTVVGGITNWSQVSAGALHSLGLTSTGVAYAWGYNNSGRLGDNTTSTRSSPVTVVGGITNWNYLSAGYKHSLAITTTII